MKKQKRSILTIILSATLLILTVLLTKTLSSHALESGWKWKRLAGNQRYETMAAITKEAFPEHTEGTVKTIIVATGESFPDALSGAALAGVYGAPVILTKDTGLSAQARSEIERLASANCKVLILGGLGAVSQKVENTIGNMGLTVERIAGSTREKTAIEVFKRGLYAVNGFSGNDTVIITTGYNYADALSISPYAYASRTPILLTKKDGTLSEVVKKVVSDDRYGFRKAIIVGGTGAVASVTEDYLNGLGMTTLRLEGKTRYATSAQIMRWEMGLLPNAAFQPKMYMTNSGMGVATGEHFADALASVSLLGNQGSVLMLVHNTNLRTTIEKNINELIKPYKESMGNGYIFGGTMVVSKEMEKLLNAAVALDPPTTPAPTPSPTSAPKRNITITSGLTFRRNQDATISINAQPGVTYSISIIYNSGPSKAAGLYPKVADANGNVSWTWHIGGRTAPGTYRVDISGNGEYIQRWFTVITD